MVAIIRQHAGACDIDQACRHAGAASQRGLQSTPGQRRIGRFRKQLDKPAREFRHGLTEIIAIRPQSGSADPRPGTVFDDVAGAGGGATDVRAGTHFGRIAEKRRPIHQERASKAAAGGPVQAAPTARR